MAIGEWRVESGERKMVSSRNQFDRMMRRTNRPRETGFTLIELIIVISIILILVSIAAPMYRNSIVRSKEAVLRDDLFTLRSLIDEYTLDKQAAPQSLQDLVDKGYLRQIPSDPFTGTSSSWVEVREDTTLMSPDQTSPGIVDLHSGSGLKSLSGDVYSSW
jgi:general secretion pathway protein G